MVLLVLRLLGLAAEVDFLVCLLRAGAPARLLRRAGAPPVVRRLRRVVLRVVVRRLVVRLLVVRRLVVRRLRAGAPPVVRLRRLRVTFVAEAGRARVTLRLWVLRLVVVRVDARLRRLAGAPPVAARGLLRRLVVATLFTAVLDRVDFLLRRVTL